MEPLTALLITAGITGVLYLVCIINFARMGRGMFDMDKSFDDTAKSFGNGFAVHAISGGLASLASLATVGCFIWFLLDKFA
jgi:hypothetical protein